MLQLENYPPGESFIRSCLIESQACNKNSSNFFGIPDKVLSYLGFLLELKRLYYNFSFEQNELQLLFKYETGHLQAYVLLLAGLFYLSDMSHVSVLSASPIMSYNDQILYFLLQMCEWQGYVVVVKQMI